MEQRLHRTSLTDRIRPPHGSVQPPPLLRKNPTSWLVASLIPSSHKGHTCEWCLLAFHTKEPQQASINGARLLSCAVMFPLLFPLDGWVNKDKTLVLGPPAVHLTSEFTQITFSHLPFTLLSHADGLFYMLRFLDICLWDFCQHYRIEPYFNWGARSIKKHLILNMKT